MSGQVEAYLGSMLSAHADLKDLLEEMKTLYEKRLWHELTLKLEEAVAEVEALGRCGDDDDGELAEWDAPTSPTVVA